MLEMKDCGIEPGDILFVVSNSNKLLVRLKQAAQSVTTVRSKHGHREVVSVFVCTGKNDYGVICHNFERQLLLPTESFVKKLQDETIENKKKGIAIEQLTVMLLNYSSREGFPVAKIKEALLEGAPWMRQLAAQVQGIDDVEELVKYIIAESNKNEEQLIQLLVTFWRASGQAEILSVVNSSLLVFKHNNRKIRESFLDAYLSQVEVAKRFREQGKKRASLWVLFKSFFQWSSQDAYDKQKHSPSDETYCSRNVMEVLNQIDPNLVNRGRHILPKSLEAGLREATKIKKAQTPANQEQFDDFEAMVDAQESLLPPFSLQILPASGKELINVLLARVDKEIDRMEHKRWANAADRQKASDLRKQLLPFRDPKYQNYIVSLQVEVTLTLLATIMPILRRKTGFFSEWISSTSYANIRAFMRTQGIFDGDIREETEKLKNELPPKIEMQRVAVDEVDSTENTRNGQIYIFSDWSFSSWSASKREFMLEHMMQLLDSGHTLYTWENGQLVQRNKASLLNAINGGDDFDDLLAGKVKPTTRAALMQQAEQQQLEAAKIQFLDYKACQNLTNDHQLLEETLNTVAPLFAHPIDEYHLNQTKRAIIDIELMNAADDETEQAALQKLKENIATQKSAQQSTYQSGIDTKALAAQPQYRKPIFKPIGSMTLTPSSKYYRDEVYSDVVINNAPSSPFEYFELQGMNATENLSDCQYDFHSQGFTKELIKKRQHEANKLPLFSGEKSISLTENWRSLPSLHPNETLLDVAIQGLKKEDFEIKYSEKNHLHYIRATKPITEPQDVLINLLLKMPKEYRAHPILNTLATNPEYPEIHHLLMKYLKFRKDNGLLRDSIGSVHNGKEYLDRARELSVGSCRLRAIAFKEEMQRLYPDVPVFVTINPDHCFIEMQLNGLWQRYCLGGYRDTPSLSESIKENSLETCNTSSRGNRFFTTKSRPQPDNVAEQNTEELDGLMAQH